MEGSSPLGHSLGELGVTIPCQMYVGELNVFEIEECGQTGENSNGVSVVHDEVSIRQI